MTGIGTHRHTLIDTMRHTDTERQTQRYGQSNTNKTQGQAKRPSDRHRRGEKARDTDQENMIREELNTRDSIPWWEGATHALQWPRSACCWHRCRSRPVPAQQQHIITRARIRLEHRSCTYIAEFLFQQNGLFPLSLKWTIYFQQKRTIPNEPRERKKGWCERKWRKRILSSASQPTSLSLAFDPDYLSDFASWIFLGNAPLPKIRLERLLCICITYL